jgi:lipopolysaccharide/colanic/teichoic acid biosynthesis glycosyltransferase
LSFLLRLITAALPIILATVLAIFIGAPRTSLFLALSSFFILFTAITTQLPRPRFILRAHAGRRRNGPQHYVNCPSLNHVHRDVVHTRKDAVALTVKRFFDIIVASLFNFLLFPLLISIAIIIKCGSSGRILVRTYVRGFDGREFKRYRFRTMSVPDEESDALRSPGDDPRITEIGWYLRRTGLDDAPELINVLRGDMSIVGPRPRFEYEYSQVSGYPFQVTIKPGITGWAQVHGYRARWASKDEVARITEYDLWYINNWSILLDARIIFMTPYRHKIERRDNP